jgi:hypothetical protein
MAAESFAHISKMERSAYNKKLEHLKCTAKLLLYHLGMCMCLLSLGIYFDEKSFFDEYGTANAFFPRDLRTENFFVTKITMPCGIEDIYVCVSVAFCRAEGT